MDHRTKDIFSAIANPKSTLGEKILERREVTMEDIRALDKKMQSPEFRSIQRQKELEDRARMRSHHNYLCYKAKQEPFIHIDMPKSKIVS